jgi:acetoacetate decarboxylase
METAYLVLNTFAMPLSGLPFPRARYRYSNREHIIAYHSSRAELVS